MKTKVPFKTDDRVIISSPYTEGLRATVIKSYSEKTLVEFDLSGLRKFYPNDQLRKAGA